MNKLKEWFFNKYQSLRDWLELDTELEESVDVFEVLRDIVNK